jgi:hypothetical protein
MIPEERLSTIPKGAAFMGARASTDIGPLLDREDGGVDLQDPSQGLLAKQWLGVCDGSDIVISASGVSPITVVTDSDITEFAFTFDQNMNVTVSYRAGGITKLNWFDIIANDQVTTTWGADYLSPRVALDDKHPLASDTSDVIFAYVRDGALYYRHQRDRYQAEKLLLADMEGRLLRKIGMNTQNRFQFGCYVPEAS